MPFLFPGVEIVDAPCSNIWPRHKLEDLGAGVSPRVLCSLPCTEPLCGDWNVSGAKSLTTTDQLTTINTMPFPIDQLSGKALEDCMAEQMREFGKVRLSISCVFHSQFACVCYLLSRDFAFLTPFRFAKFRFHSEQSKLPTNLRYGQDTARQEQVYGRERIQHSFTHMNSTRTPSQRSLPALWANFLLFVCMMVHRCTHSQSIVVFIQLESSQWLRYIRA